MKPTRHHFTRRQFLRTATAAGALVGMESLFPAYSRAGIRTGSPIDLAIDQQIIDIGGHRVKAIAVNGTVPGPLIRLREGDEAIIRVTNRLTDSDSSIHWHGLILPFQMDGVPGVSFPGIRPSETFTYRFPVHQNGTYWYHSHTAVQEQLGVYGPMIIDPAGTDPVRYDREYVVVLSDWLSGDPMAMVAKLKKQSSYSNYQRRTVGDFIGDATKNGLGAALKDRWQWGKMRMDPTDITDITGHHLTFLMNGFDHDKNWTGIFRTGERVRLRFINAAAVTFFDVRIPGLRMSVVQADGQNVKPVTVDEFRIGIAETYDVIVEPTGNQAYTIFAETTDRSGFARGTLAPREGMTAALPQQRERAVRTMADMGMAMTGDMAGMPGMPQGSGDEVAMHGPDKHGAGNSSIAMAPKNRLGEPGIGLEGMPWRVLVYNDLQSLAANYDHRLPEREIELHATGNMEQYIWGFDGKKYSEAKAPIEFYYGERLRFTWVNDTMMDHPLHLHGMFMELDNGHGIYNPRKHTVVLKPGEKISLNITADAPGLWAFHCHILYHMEVGMFRVVSVAPRP